MAASVQQRKVRCTLLSWSVLDHGLHFGKWRCRAQVGFCALQVSPPFCRSSLEISSKEMNIGAERLNSILAKSAKEGRELNIWRQFGAPQRFLSLHSPSTHPFASSCLGHGSTSTSM